MILVEIPRGFITDPYHGLERELAAKYDFLGVTPLTVPEALAVKEELDKIEDKMLDIIEELAEVLDEGIKEMRAIASGESEKYYATQRKEAEKSK